MSHDPKPSPEGVIDSAAAIFGTDRWLMAEVGFEQIKSAVAAIRVGDSPKVRRGDAKQGDIGLIEVIGPVAYRDNWISEIFGWATVTGIQRQLKAFDQDDEIAEVKMVFDTPGGVVTGAPETSLIISNYSKPINAFADSVCASLGYWYASQCNTLSATQLSMIGSIGVVMSFDPDDKARNVYSKNAQHKQGSKESLSALVNDIEDMFVESVAIGRDVTPEHVVEHYGQGGIFTGLKAVEIGMADSISTLEDFIAGDSNPPAPSAISTSSTGANNGMKNDNNEAGGIPVKEHTDAVSAAREAGKKEAEASHQQALDDAREAGKAEAKAEAEAEASRVSAIREAGKNKKPEVVQKFIDDKTEAAQAVSLLELMDDVKNKGNLSARMNGTNPDITDTGGDDEDDDGAAKAKAEIDGWDDVYGGKK